MTETLYLYSDTCHSEERSDEGYLFNNPGATIRETFDSVCQAMLNIYDTPETTAEPLLSEHYSGKRHNYKP